MSLSKNFNKTEFDCKCGCLMPYQVYLNVQLLASNLQVVRDLVDKPILITSGFRCITHNSNVGGVRDSFHTQGLAADFFVRDMSVVNVFRLMKLCIKENTIAPGGLGLYPTFVHYDLRNSFVSWQR